MLTQEQLNSFNSDTDDNGNRKALAKLGGIDGIIKGLNTSTAGGIKGGADTLKERIDRYGANEVKTYTVF